MFMARFAPTAAPERLKIISCWNYWGFAFDGYLDGDLPEDFPVVVARVQRALDIPAPVISDDKWTASLQDVGNMLRSLGTPSQVRRFVKAHQAWLFATVWRDSNHAIGRLPSLDEYLSLRVLDAGGEEVFQLVAFAEDLKIPGDEMDSLLMQALIESATLVAGLDNDRHSFVKEDREFLCAQHLFSVLMQERGISLKEALWQGCKLRDRVLRRFLCLQDRVMTVGSAHSRTFAQLLGQGIRGNLDWATANTRYGQTAESYCLTDTPIDGDPAPPAGAPSIAWWWQV
jgi:hypothetical protein